MTAETIACRLFLNWKRAAERAVQVVNMMKLVKLGLSVVLLGMGPVMASERPLVRPTPVGIVLPAGGSVLAVARSQRPIIRGTAQVTREAPVVLAAGHSGFDAWVKAFRPRAKAAGISDATFERAFRGVRYDPEVIKRDRNQSEFTKTLWDYLDSAASNTRITNGKSAIAKHRSTLQRIEARYGVRRATWRRAR